MKLKRLVAIFLVVTMTVGALPSLVLADENDGAPNETKVVESTEPEEKKPAKPAETKPTETKPAETKPAETTVKETEQPDETKPAETTAAEPNPAETTKPESTEPAETTAPEKETPDATEPVEEPKENIPTETDAKKPALSGDKEDGEKKIDFTIEDKTKTYISLKDFDNDELFRQYIQRKLTVTKGTKRRALDSVSGRSKLTGNNLILYDSFKAQIAMVAEGSLTSTHFTVPISELGLSNPTVYTKEQFGVESLVQGEGIIPELEAAIKAAVDYSGEQILDALLADCPYELYWFKKNSKTKFSGTGAHVEGNGDQITVTWKATEFTADLQVAQPYAADTYVTNPTEINRANTAISNAATIVSSAKSKSDYQKLVFYINEICKRVVYDKTAAQNGSESNMDPWQLISVFDNDDTTNVVCEGYAKAFKYLCDLTEFKNDISCITVTGTLTTPSVNGPHMWNIVSMDDGNNYLVDVTHCDAGSTGDPTMMFMRGYKSGDISNGYICPLGSRDFSYVYDEYTVSTYTDAQITISNKDYKAGGSIIDSGTCGANLTWTYDDKGILTISGTGAMTDWTTPDNLPWKQHKNDITEIVISDGVTTIGNLAFCNLRNVKNFNIPEGVTSIGYGAFQNCAITSVNFPSSVTAIGTEAFYGCVSLKNLTIPETVKTIGDRAFALCSGLETVVISEKITSLGAGAFSDCSGLVSVILNRDAYSQTAFPGIKTSLIHYYYTVTYASVSHGTVSGKTETYGSDTVELTIEPAPGYDLVKLTWSTATGTPAELKPGTDGKYVMPDSNDDIIITPVFRFGTGYVLSGESVFRSSASDATVRFIDNAAGTYYYVVNTDSTAPSAEEIKAASSGIYGNGAAAAGTVSINITGMSSGKQYCHIALFDGEFSSNVLTFEMPYDFYYFDDFDSYAKDTTVTSGKTPYTLQYNGTGNDNQKITGSVQMDGATGKVLQLQGSSGWASNVRCNIAPDGKQFLILKVSMKTVEGTYAGGIGFGSSQASGRWTHAVCALDAKDGKFYHGVNDTGEMTDTDAGFSNGNWYELTLVLDRTNNVFYTYVNGKRTGYVFEADTATPEWLSLQSGNDNTTTTYFDNVCLYSTDSFEVDTNVYCWGDLQAALIKGGTVKLIQDIVDNNKGGELVIPQYVVTDLDLNGYVIDRKGNEHLFYVEGTLTINDSNPTRTHSPEISYKNPVTGDAVVITGGVITGAFRSAIRGVYGSIITMNGGTVCGNTSDDLSAIDLTGSVFRMYGGAIVNNSTTSNGGAVRVYENASFEMYDGKIAHNTADKKGGGFYLWNNQNNSSILNMSGGEISENVSGSNGAGVCVDSNSWFNVSGTAKIKDNKKGPVENNVSGGIYVSAALKDGARIGVSTYYDPAVNSPLQITFGGYSTFNNGEDPSKYFFSDKGFKVGLVTTGTYKGEVQLELELVNVSFVDGATTIDKVAVVPGAKISQPKDPVKTGYRFIGWYADPEFEHPFVFDSEITGDTTIYANFIQEFTVTVTSGTADKAKAIAGETVTVTASAAPEGSVFDKWTAVTGTVPFADATATETTFAMPAENVEVKATYKVKSGTCGESGSDLKWDIDYATGTLTITGTGKMENWGDTDSVPWYSARESIKAVVISDGVTSIGNRAFNGYSNISKVTIAGTVDTIGYWAFSKCTKLETVELPEGVTTINGGAFNGCTGLKSITIPDSVKTIGDNAFKDCSKLESVKIPDGAESLGSDAFDNCTSLGSVVINSKIYDGDKFSGCAPGSIHFYYDVAYTVGANGTVTGKTRSYATDKIELTVTPDAGYVLDKLILVYEGTEIAIAPDTNGKFMVAMPESQNGAEIKATFKVAGTEVVGDYVYVITNPMTDGTGTVTLTGLANPVTAVSIPAEVEINGITYKVNRIGAKAFYGNKSITTLSIGANVVIIDAYAFYACSNLTKVSGGYRVQTIGTSAFAYCSKLSSFTITSVALKKIGNYAFNKDKKLKTVYIKNTTKLTKSGVKKSLKGSSVKTVKVKKSKVKKYKKYFKKSNSGRKVKVKK